MKKNRTYSCYDWNRLRYVAVQLWNQGLRSGDSTIINLQYGYDEKQTEILCDQLEEMEAAANKYLEYYNPDLGF